MDVDVIEQIHQMGGLQLVMPQAFAETDCGALADLLDALSLSSI